MLSSDVFCSHEVKVVSIRTFGRIDWVGLRLACGEDGRGWPTRGPQEISQFSCKMSAIPYS